MKNTFKDFITGDKTSPKQLAETFCNLTFDEFKGRLKARQIVPQSELYEICVDFWYIEQSRIRDKSHSSNTNSLNAGGVTENNPLPQNQSIAFNNTSTKPMAVSADPSIDDDIDKQLEDI